MALIDVVHLGKTYTDDGTETLALSDVSFTIEKGEFVAIMGPSGSGKSTLLHMLGFLDLPTHGTYTFEGKEMSDYTADEISRVRNQKMGFIFQSFNLLARTSVLENVKLPLLYSKIPESKWDKMALKAIDSVGLAGKGQRCSQIRCAGQRRSRPSKSQCVRAVQ